MPTQIDWRGALLDLLKKLGTSWDSPGEAVWQSACDLVGKWIGGDNAELGAAVAQALQDGRVTEAELEAMLLTVAKAYAPECPLGKPFADALIADLGDGKLSAQEIAGLAATWAVSRTDDPQLKALFQAAEDGYLTLEEIEAAVLQWLRDQGQPALADALAQILASSSPFTTRTLVLLLTAYFVQRGRITAVGATPGEQTAALIAVLTDLTDPALIELVKALVEQRYPDAVRLLLSTLGVTADEAAIRALLQGDLAPLFQQLLAKTLARELEGVTEEQATALAATVVRLLKGEEKLIPEQTEQQALQMGDWEYGIWLRVRRVLYAARLAALGGPLVPTDPMAQPHVFAAAAIGSETPVKTLAEEEQWDYLLEYMWVFSRTEFAPHLHTPPIDRAGLVACKTAYFVHLQIASALT